MNERTPTQLPSESLEVESEAGQPQPESELLLNETAKTAVVRKQRVMRVTHRKSMHNLLGRVFDLLTVIRFFDMGKRGKDSRWLCACVCGKESVHTASALLGPIKTPAFKRSCGCSKTYWKKHGYTSENKNSTEYNSWMHMHSRCGNFKNPDWKDYGGRGITVCDRWFQFENFIADMGPKPTAKHSIDRYPNNDGNYDPSNCRWATAQEQANNSRWNLRIAFNGKVKTLAQWGRSLHISPSTLGHRLRRGWSTEKALTRKIGRWVES